MKTALLGAAILGLSLATAQPAAATATFTDDFNRADGPAGADWQATPFGFPVWTIRNNAACSDAGGLNVLAQPYCGGTGIVTVDFSGDTLRNYESSIVAASGDYSAVRLCELTAEDGNGAVKVRIRDPFTHTDYAVAASGTAVTLGAAYTVTFSMSDDGTASCTLSSGMTVLQQASGNMPWIEPQRWGFVLSGGEDEPDGTYACGDDFSLEILDTVDCPLPPSTTTTLAPTTTTLMDTTTTLAPTTTTLMETTTTTIPDGGPLCGATPRNDCEGGAAGQARLKMKTGRKPSLVWKLGAGDAVEDFGDPVGGGTRVAFCLYDSSAAAQPLLTEDVAGGSGWRATSTGVRYLAADGSTQVSLVPGKADGKTQIKVVMEGDGAAPSLPVTHGVTAQLVVDEGGTRSCWQTVFSSAKVNDERRYSAQGPE